MVGQVKTVSILMIVQGGLTCLMGVFLVGVGPAMFFMSQMAESEGERPADEMDTMMMTVMSAVYMGLGLLTLTAGLLDIVAGIRCLRFRNRTFAIVALFSNVPCVFTCYCAPTAIGIMVYGLIVFFNQEVRQAFELVAAGEPVRSVVARFTRRYRGDWDDDEEEDEPLD